MDEGGASRFFDTLASRLSLDHNLVEELVGLFLRQSETDWRMFLAAVGNGDLEAAADAVHSLKGGAVSLGLVTLGDLAQRAESALRSGDLELARAAMTPLSGELQRVRRESGLSGHPAALRGVPPTDS